MIMKNRWKIVALYVLILIMVSYGAGPPCPICENCKSSAACGNFPLYSADGLHIAECITKCDQVSGCKLIEYEPTSTFCKLYDCTVLDINATGYQSLLCSVNCGNPPAPANGNITSTGVTTVGATAIQTCNSGYTRNGGATISCLYTGLWSNSSTCSIKDCGSPPSPVHGAVSLTSAGVTTYEATATQSCDEGYDLTGDTEIQCQATGKWNSTVICTIKDCGSPRITAHGVVMLSNLGETTYGATATLVCDEGYSPDGDENVQCQTNGTWSSTVTCIVTDCGTPPSPDHGGVTLTSPGETTYGATATQSCDEGYSIAGVTVIQCQTSGLWSSTVTCTVKDCGSPPSPVHGAVALTNPGVTTYEATATQSCEEGYDLNGVTEIQCQATGNWSSTVICTIKDCGRPPPTAHGVVMLSNLGETTYGATATLVCDEGYSPDGDEIVQCQVNGTWSLTFTCIITDCGTPPSPDHGGVTLASPGETIYGATATQSCDGGYSIAGVTVIQCQTSGLWSSTVTCTVKDCGSPPSPVHGAVALTNPGVTTYEATATQSCDEVYDLSGVTEIQCQATGNWSSTVICTIKDCGRPPTTAHGVFLLSNLGETTYGATANLVCNEGYSPDGDENVQCQANGTWSLTVTCMVTALPNSTPGLQTSHQMKMLTTRNYVSDSKLFSFYSSQSIHITTVGQSSEGFFNQPSNIAIITTIGGVMTTGSLALGAYYMVKKKAAILVT